MRKIAGYGITCVLVSCVNILALLITVEYHRRPAYVRVDNKDATDKIFRTHNGKQNGSVTPTPKVLWDNAVLAGHVRSNKDATDKVFRMHNGKQNGSVTPVPKVSWDNAILAGHVRSNKGLLTIGIPTMKRPRGFSYLVQTIESLINNTDSKQLMDIVIVVFLADSDQTSRDAVRDLLVEKFSDEIESGLLRIIQADRQFYPSFENLPRTYKHSAMKVKWRSKQNYDYAYMMLYSQELSQYYMQLEDDVTTVPGYLDAIKQFILQNRRKHWTCLEFSSLGFIAKLYHSYDLEKLAKLLMLFFYEQPNDITYIFFNQLKLQDHRIVRKPTLFKHNGLHSTLAEKRETRSDPLFENVSNETRDLSSDNVTFINNPPAKLSSTLQIYNNHKLEDCYLKKGMMWSDKPGKGGKVTIGFDKPQKILNITVVTGSSDHPDDFLQKGILQVGQEISWSRNHMECSGIFATKPFKFGEVHFNLDETLRDINAACVQILVLEAQGNWLQVSEITIVVTKR